MDDLKEVTVGEHDERSECDAGVPTEAEAEVGHLHLDPVGGIAGDMFAAAFVDLRPELAGELDEAFQGAGLSAYVRLRSWEYRDDHALTGHRFDVEEQDSTHDAHHRAYRDICGFLKDMRLAPSVLQRALTIFELLAQAEGQVHGLPAEEVSFHEVGGWDSIADIVAAAWLIDRFAGATWSCAPLPLGSGRVASAHGRLPVPAPATAVLLHGYPVYQDSMAGERITPTGAAIVRHLNPSFEPANRAMRLAGSGTGFGSRSLPGTSNILRVLAFDRFPATYASETIDVLQFEVDDQTPEDLSVALDKMRAVPGVLDVAHTPVFGKKGRVAAQIQVLVRPTARSLALEHCFTETTTLGVRWHPVQRAVLERMTASVETGGHKVRVKRARRPGGITTSKAEMEDLAVESGGLGPRERLRREAERLVLSADEAHRKKQSNTGDS
jgi:uncharacterized protein (TIGR00299 family) protein